MKPRTEFDYQNLATSHSFASQPISSEPKSYRLRAYRWRAFLGIVGPILLCGFYAYICFYYLNVEAQNEIIVDVGAIDAIAPFYAWFVVSILALDWARTGLANFQAAALMHPTSAPSSGMEFFWHVDDTWANPLWWLRALRNAVFSLIIAKGASGRANTRYRSHPGLLWCCLGLVSLLIFLAVPLSGLTMELRTISTPGGDIADILGPKDTTFNFKGMTSLPQTIHGMWKTGGKVTPSDLSLFFAPAGSDNVSATYFEDEIVRQPEGGFTSFLSPAINGVTSGSVTGLENSVNCNQVAAEDLNLIELVDYGNYSVRAAQSTDAQLQWFNETAVFFDYVPYSFIAAADGAYYGSTPYVSETGHDYNTYSSVMNISDPSRPSEGLFELFLWQGLHPEFNDTRMSDLLDSNSPLLSRTSKEFLLRVSSPDSETGTSANVTIPLIGYAIQCRITSAFGLATINPATRTYTNFSIRNVTGTGSDEEVYPPQIQSVHALGEYDALATSFKPLHVSDPASYDSRWMTMHLAIADAAYEICGDDCGTKYNFGWNNRYAYNILSPQNTTYAIYRLIGQSLIAMMGPGSSDPWQMPDLRLMRTVRWIEPGPVPWKVVLGLLCLWTVALVGVSTWTLFTKRWAPILGGFELFRLGAQWEQEVGRMRDVRFEGCEILRGMPGMVGAVSGGGGGTRRGGGGVDDVAHGEGKVGGDLGFIGLSDVKARSDGVYVYDRRMAASTTQGWEMRRRGGGGGVYDNQE